ncbi:AAA family ATPase [Bacillus sp. FSL K6-3431]|uniref:AAA family ATPase n=1 Tax=Bacillus sp. FSL K6-3431 TaxID=2921500 RepID=UPI0030F8B449
MKKLQLVIVEADSLFLKSFSEYIMSSNLQSKFDVKLFSSSTSMNHYIASGQSYDILLVQPDLYNEEMQNDEKSMVVFLQETKENMENDIYSVYKYQPLNKMLSSILSAYYENHSTFSGIARKGIKTKVLSFYSPVGGSGKTTVSVNMSRQLALMGNKVFYLNLELLNTTSLYFQPQGDLPSLQILYYLKARPDQLLAKVEALKKFDDASKVDYFDLPPCPDEMMSITKDETKRLIQALIETENYDYILIDLDSAIHERIEAAIEESNQVIWLLNNDLQSFHKTSAMLERMDDVFGAEHHLAEKVAFVMNHFTGQFPEAYHKYNLPIRGYLPNIVEWFQVIDTQQVLYHPLFMQELLSIIEDIIVRDQAGVTVD